MTVYVKWKRMMTSPYTWKTILDVLDKTGHKELAETIKQKLLGKETYEYF